MALSLNGWKGLSMGGKLHMFCISYLPLQDRLHWNVQNVSNIYSYPYIICLTLYFLLLLSLPYPTLYIWCAHLTTYTLHSIHCHFPHRSSSGCNHERKSKASISFPIRKLWRGLGICLLSLFDQSMRIPGYLFCHTSSSVERYLFIIQLRRYVPKFPSLPKGLNLVKGGYNKRQIHNVSLRRGESK